MKKVILAALVLVSFASCKLDPKLNNYPRCTEQGFCGGHLEHRYDTVFTYCIDLPHSKSIYTLIK